MRRSTKLLISVACLCLLSLQLSGAHLHVDDSGNIKGLELPFSLSHGHHDHPGMDHAGGHDTGHADDHEDARDVSLQDPALSIYKQLLAMPALLFLFALSLYVRTLASCDFASRVLSGRHTRWRPPLRAPPQPALT